MLQKQASLGFSRTVNKVELENDYKAMKDKVMDELKRRFRPEFLNRLDNVMVFRSLTREEIAQIVEIMLRDFKQLLDERELAITLTDEAKEVLVDQGYDPNYGARPLRRVIQQLIVDQLSEGLLAGEYSAGDMIHIDGNEARDGFTFRAEPGAAFSADALDDAILDDDSDLDGLEELFMGKQES